jgi:hypothetical protein
MATILPSLLVFFSPYVRWWGRGFEPAMGRNKNYEYEYEYKYKYKYKKCKLHK